MSNENINLLSQEEWRTIHNALTFYQNTFGDIQLSGYARNMRERIQQLMDKVRDNYIIQYSDS